MTIQAELAAIKEKAATNNTREMQQLAFSCIDLTTLNSTDTVVITSYSIHYTKLYDGSQTEPDPQQSPGPGGPGRNEQYLRIRGTQHLRHLQEI